MDGRLECIARRSLIARVYLGILIVMDYFVPGARDTICNKSELWMQFIVNRKEGDHEDAKVRSRKAPTLLYVYNF